MIDIAPAVWDAWQKQWQELGAEFTLRMRLASSARTRAVTDALQAALGEVGAEFERLPPRDELEGNAPLFGHWEWARTPGGVVVSVTECDDFPLALRRVADAWQRRDIAGRLELWDAEPVPARIEDAVPLRCHIRVRGERRRTDRGGYLWEPDRAAHEAVVRAVCNWSGQLGSKAEYVINSGTGRMRWTGDGDVGEHVFDALDRRTPVTFIGTAAGGGRMFRAEAFAGRVSLSAFGACVAGDAWRGDLSALAALLRAAAASIAYAFVARGRDAWPPRPQDQPYGPAQTDEAFEDLYVPDTFGLQLLAPSIAARVPPVTLWHAERLGGGPTLLSSTDPDAWFADAGPPPLDRARAELEPILYAKGILSDAGYDDVDPV